jgi:hypothetical protein
VNLTHHPFQRAGAWAAAAVTGKDHPALLGDGDLDDLAAMITADATQAAIAGKDSPGYAWWLVLFACYPNSPATHPARARWGRDQIASRISGLFAGDDPAAIEGPCDLCGTPASRRWGKSLRPLAAAADHVNSQPAGGHPVCRECRIALWLLPYGSASNGRLLVTCGTVADEALEAAIGRRCVTANRDAISSHLDTWGPGQGWLRPVLSGLADHPGDWELLRWRNDSKAPFLQSLRLTEEAATRLAAWEELAAVVSGAPAGDPVRSEVEDQLAVLRDRDWIVRAAVAAGLNVNQIHRLSGVSRNTIYKILGKEPPMKAPQSKAAARAEKALAVIANLGYRVKGRGNADLTTTSPLPADVYVWASQGETYVEAWEDAGVDMDAIRAALVAAGIPFTERAGTRETE